MAAHNQVRALGYLLKDPVIQNEDMAGEEKAYLEIRIRNREVDGYPNSEFQDVLVFYDGASGNGIADKLMSKIKNLKQYDLIDIKGVINVLSVNKRSECPYCGERNVKTFGISCFIYPISLIKLNGLQIENEKDIELPERLLRTHYEEISNDVDILGTVVNEPELMKGKYPCCRYMLAVDRKYYIKTQDTIYTDFPWVYSYGKLCNLDYEYLQPGALVLISGFLRNRLVRSDITCKNCGSEYQYEDIATEIIPYSVEYMRGHKRDFSSINDDEE